MADTGRALLLIGVMALGTMCTRFLPFVLLRGKTPPFVSYLGRVLPYATMGMLVVYCLKGLQFTGLSGWVPSAAGVAVTAGLHLWKRSTILSILGGTIVYMLLVQTVF